jgi:AraC family transcriptional regulator
MRHATVDSIALVVRAMQENVGETFTNDEMARVAMFSKFHFARVFQDVTGVSPGRFLAALRIAEAKRLLLTTTLSVTDISVTVGYASVGTFSTRFKGSVGLSPSEFRANGGYRPLPRVQVHHPVGQGRDLTGHIASDVELSGGPVFMGVFPETIPKGLPVSCAVLPRPGPFRIQNVPFGQWHLLAYAERPATTFRGHHAALRRQHEHDSLLIGSAGPVVVAPNTTPESFTISLNAPTPFDPPILLAPFALPESLPDASIGMAAAG